MGQLNLTDAMPFGEHIGEQVEDLIYDHPTYVAWLIEKQIVEFDEDVTTMLEDLKII